jgi:C4-dicarboxylate-specific signal transduction histidine kinase
MLPDTSRPRLLVIHSQAGEGEVQVTISDSGMGLRPDTVSRLFDPFFTTKPHGLGLGLAISRSIVESHGGRLWALESAGPGAAFRFTLLACSPETR